ncbi:MAG: hypothetical protein EOO88_45750, partial [Pedobacter sp.]
MKSALLSLLLLTSCFSLSAQTAPVPVKRISARRVTSAPKIDGVLDDAVWEGVPLATDFIQSEPNPGQVERKNKRTEVRFIYDDN